MIKTEALAQGFYTVPEAARLIRVGSARRIHGWLRGYPNRDIGPLLTRDYDEIPGADELSFLDLMEVRFVEHFREYGVKVRSLRIAADELRNRFETKHPFALRNVLLVADRADVFVIDTLKESAQKAQDPKLYSLTTRNYAMYEAIKQALLPGVSFDPKSGLADEWKPIPDKFPTITVSPLRAFGQPTTQRGVPTSTLFDAWKAEGENIDTVAEWYGMKVKDVLSAVQFEQALNNPTLLEAA